MKAPSFDVATVITEKYNFSLSELKQIIVRATKKKITCCHQFRQQSNNF